MEVVIIVIFILLILSGIGGTIWYVNKKSKCNLPDTNSCKNMGDDSYLQVPYCASDTNTTSCGNSSDICGKNIPANCQEPYCDWSSSTPSWKCNSSGSQNYSCVNNSCVADKTGTFTSLQDCNASCGSTDKNCTPINKNLPWPATDGSTVYTNTKTVDQYGSYTFTQVGTQKACKLSCDSSKSTLKADTNGIWCDPLDDGTMCSTSEYQSLPDDKYKGPYPDPNAKYVIAYQNYINSTQFCKFDSCLPPYTLNSTTMTCLKNGSSCSPIQFATGYDDKCVPTGCNDPTDPITVYGLDPTGKFCTGKSCTQPSGDFYQYTNTGTLGKCVKTQTCIPDINIRKQYDPANNCNAVCTGDSCKAFIGVDASDGFPFACNTNGRSCTVRDDGTGWGGCGNSKYPQYGPKGDGTCASTIFEQRARFNDGTDKNSPVGCITCLGGPSCNPWDTDSSKCSFDEGCTYGEAKSFGTPTEAINECTTEKSNMWGGYSFGPISPLKTGEQASSYTNSGSADIIVDSIINTQQCSLYIDNAKTNFNPNRTNTFSNKYNSKTKYIALTCDGQTIFGSSDAPTYVWGPATLPPQKSADLRIYNVTTRNGQVTTVNADVGGRNIM
jgi:hypothetical protein